MGWHRIALGIGNPGPEYEQTRHNIGFMVLDLVAERLGLAFSRLERRGPDGAKRFSGKVKAKFCEGHQNEQSFALVKPQSYVNLSGEVAAPMLRHAEREPDSLFVIVDDLNLPLGRIRIRPSGSAGGHNGLKSIQQHLGTDAFPRLRLGIGQSADSAGDSKSPPIGGSEGPSKGISEAAIPLAGEEWPDFVLAPFLPEEREVLGPVLGRASDCVLAWLGGADLQNLMGTYNGTVTPPTPGDDDGAGVDPAS
ncbi:MAG: aminoacyl-tRNA hydrolase [bacterium]|nr:aminoacyl-tRNA hydrolase [bacterium]